MADNNIASLLAESEIRKKLALYSRGIDRMDPDAWKQAWHPDATMRYESGQLDGSVHDYLLLMAFGHYTWGASLHQSTRSSIRVDGDRAVSETHNMAILHGYEDKSGLTNQDLYRGRYLDRWSKRDGVWAIDSRVAPGGCMWRQFVEAEVGPQSRRADRRDPSYALFASLDGEESGQGIETLHAERAIRRQLQVYCQAIDRLDGKLWQSVWHDDGTLADSHQGLDGNAAKLAETVMRRYGALATHLHSNTNVLLRLSGDKAVSETCFNNILRPHPASSSAPPEDRHIWGRYLDTWSKRQGRWAIDHREVVLDFAWKQPVAAAATGANTRRDRVDPSCASVN